MDKKVLINSHYLSKGFCQVPKSPAKKENEK
jgi:hypothetical protein